MKSNDFLVWLKGALATVKDDKGNFFKGKEVLILKRIEEELDKSLEEMKEPKKGFDNDSEILVRC